MKTTKKVLAVICVVAMLAGALSTAGYAAAGSGGHDHAGCNS